MSATSGFRPGQTLVHDFPVLSAGPTPDIDTADWEFTVRTESGATSWNWDEFMSLGDRRRRTPTSTA